MQPLSGPQFPHIGNEQLGFAQVLKLGSTKPRVFFKSQDLGSRREAQGGPASRLLNRGWSLCLHTRNMELKISARPWTGHHSLRLPCVPGPTPGGILYPLRVYGRNDPPGWALGSSPNVPGLPEAETSVQKVPYAAGDLHGERCCAGHWGELEGTEEPSEALLFSKQYSSSLVSAPGSLGNPQSKRDLGRFQGREPG